MTELKIVATLIIKNGYNREFEEILHFIADESRKESGNISYEIHQDIKNPLKFIILETWKSQEAINEHNLTLHFKKFTDSIKNKIDMLQIDIIKKIY